MFRRMFKRKADKAYVYIGTGGHWGYLYVNRWSIFINTTSYTYDKLAKTKMYNTYNNNETETLQSEQPPVRKQLKQNVLNFYMYAIAFNSSS